MTAVALQSLFCFLFFVPACWLKTRGGGVHTAHLLQGKRQLESLPPPEAICPYTTFCAAHCTCPFCPSVTVPRLSLRSSFCPPVQYHSLPVPSVRLSPTATSQFLALSHPLYIVHLLSSALSLFYLLLSLCICGEKLPCSKWDDPCCEIQNVRISPVLKCVLIFCCYLRLLILSISSTALVFSPVFTCMGWKVSCQIMWNTATRYVIFNLWALIHCRACFSKMSSIM